ncbi:hypothetical protein QAD02_000392 [Eretmocerus hayati]|uniref:Uncharacterized protein n=1 Tax=Eretmocerus hayati TaxID=131215 RepID=A0ACC2NDW8_9HYME|nr:hypothetical protein QAD02_000392 [Eretmocerus hayati]
MALRESNKSPGPVQKNNEDEEPQKKFVLDPEEKSSLNHFQECWKKKDKEGLKKSLQVFFEDASNPYQSVLKMLMNVGKLHPPSLGDSIMDGFCRWIGAHGDKYKHFLNTNLKLLASQVVMKKNSMEFTQKIFVAFDFSSDKQFFSDRIQECLLDKKFREAGNLVLIFDDLQTSFEDPEVLLLPLILQNNLNIVRHIVSKHPKMQRTVVTYLDNLLAPGEKTNKILKEFVSANGIQKTEEFFKRPPDKLVTYLAKLYNLPSEVWPNVYNRRKNGALYHIVKEHYTVKSSSLESFRESARDILGHNIPLVVEFLKCLIRFDAHEALYFAKIYNVPKYEWPRALYKFKGLTPEEIDKEIDDNQKKKRKTNNNAYYSYKLPRDTIRIVNDAKSFEDLLVHGLKDVDIVGIDTESKPNHSINEEQGLATLQIATKANVFIVDTLALEKGFEQQWSELDQILFSNENVLKLGFALGGDIALVRKYFLPNINRRDKNFLDLSAAFKRLRGEKTFKFPIPADPASKSGNLSKLVELTLGSELCKSEQCSDWNRRPLREEQIIYAALDAYCLLDVYEALIAQWKSPEISFHDFCMKVPPKSEKRVRSKKNRRPSKPKPVEPKPV